MTWADILIIIVTFCGHVSGPGIVGRELSNQCRHDRIQCIQNATSMSPNAVNGVNVVDACLSDPKIFPEAKPLPIPSGKK